MCAIWHLRQLPAASEQNCSVENCKVLPVGEDLESEFRLKASEKGVRIIYLNLKIGNSSYNPLDLPDEIVPTVGFGLRRLLNLCCLCR